MSFPSASFLISSINIIPIAYFTDYIGDMLFKLIISTKENFSDDDKRISQQVMTLWTNFAKSGSVTINQSNVTE